jgi:hypothetical protein
LIFEHKRGNFERMCLKFGKLKLKFNWDEEIWEKGCSASMWLVDNTDDMVEISLLGKQLYNIQSSRFTWYNAYDVMLLTPLKPLNENV